MSTPSNKMLDKLVAALSQLPCAGPCIAYNDADENESNNFTTVINGRKILFFIPTYQMAEDMSQVSNAVERIRKGVYNNK